MVSLREIEQQLDRVGCNFKLWGRSEICELANILMPEEQIAQAVNGSYEGGFALLCVTNYRVLLVDRKPMMLTIEDIRYDMLSEVDYNNRLFGATVRLFTPTRNLVFTSWSSLRIRKCVNYIQQRVMEIRNHGLTAQQLQTQVNGVPQFGPQVRPSAAGVAGAATDVAAGLGLPYTPVNPYTKSPMLMRRKRFPSFY